MGQRCRCNGRVAVLSPLTFCLTSLGRLILMCRGFSDIRNSKVVSATGTTLLTSGPNWIFLMVRRTELLRENTKKSLLTDHIPKATEKTIALNEESLIGSVKKNSLTVCPPSRPGFHYRKLSPQTPRHISARQRQAINQPTF